MIDDELTDVDLMTVSLIWVKDLSEGEGIDGVSVVVGLPVAEVEDMLSVLLLRYCFEEIYGVDFLHLLVAASFAVEID